MKKKKITIHLLVYALLLFTVSGCGNTSQTKNETVSEIFTQSVEKETKNPEIITEVESATKESTTAGDSKDEVQSTEKSTEKPTETIDIAAIVKNQIGATYYNSEAEAKAALYDAIKNNEDSIYVAWCGNNNLYNEITKNRMVYDSYSEYVLSAGPCSMDNYSLNGQNIVALKFSIYSSNGNKEQQIQAIEKIKSFVNSIKGKSKYEQIRDAYEWTYNIASYDAEKTVHSGQSLYSAVIANKTVCGGYAKTFQFIMEELGIPCKLITGANPDIGVGIKLTQEEYYKYRNTWVPESESWSAGHAWNLVELDGTWYYIDSTQSRYSNNDEKVPTPFTSRFLTGKDKVFYKKLEDTMKIGDMSYCGAGLTNLVEKTSGEKYGDNYTGTIELSPNEVYYLINGRKVSFEEYSDAQKNKS